MLKTRVITAIILLAVLLPMMLFASLSSFGILISIMLVFPAWEWARLLKLPGVWPFFYAALTGIILTIYILAGAPRGDMVLKAASIFWIIIAPFVLFYKPILSSGWWRTFLLASGLVLFVACWYAISVARAIGFLFILSLFLIVWLADIGAYFIGKRFGRHKLAPIISPSKTWEGAVGGCALVIIVAALTLGMHRGLLPTVTSMLFGHIGIIGEILALSVLVVFSIVGDLFESLLKRQAGLKDSSQLLPGHGGVLDRVDALLPVLPLAMLFFS
ncbi:phosphatidate cytidylyltransferase [Candidatus Vallotia cooleyia]|uniref:phosphatidate cytidylyltransferase n=1 Tax=Candidatus Vallotiella adelgis TaxID=1177211 RepID=UPI001D016319|nr:phosphatidate cytidylyltransferase [Candidatus Vallotia cooleyia]UDG81900.1 Phosphatidate cytidylyltransferase [Candidatus Vallotia cooleyia]